MALLCVVTSQAHAQSASQAVPQTGAHTVLEALGARFERNAGQAPADAHFVAQGPGYALLLTARGAVIRGHGQRDVRIVFPGGETNVPPVGEAAAPGVVNYLLGNDPSNWHTNIPTFERVRYRDVYPGVDVTYHVSQGEMEYDVIVAPGADPKRIRMRFDGADRLSFEANGDLTIHVGNRALTMRRPVLYQETGHNRRPVDGAFVRLANGDVGFDVGAYDIRVPLIIDPVLVYSTFLPVQPSLSGSNPLLPTAVAIAPGGGIYVVGTALLPFASGTQNDLFVAKLNPSGTSIAFTSYIGGTSADVPKAVALGPSDEIYVAGQTSSYDFPSVLTSQSLFGGGTDAFLAKLVPTGDVLEYATFAGGSADDVAEALAVDGDGNAYLVGTTKSVNFPLFASSASFTGVEDAFVVKYLASGVRVFSLLLGGSFTDQAHAARLAPDGTLLVGGETISANFPITSGAYKTTLTGFDGFVTRLSPDDGHVIQSTFLGGTSQDEIRAVGTDGSGAVYVTGETRSLNFPVTAGVVQPLYPGASTEQNAFVTKLRDDLGDLLYSTFVGGLDVDSASSIAVDAAGQAILVGTMQLFASPPASVTFPQVDALFPVADANRQPSFISKLSADASHFVYSTYWPATITALALGPAGDAYVVGNSNSSAYPTTGSALPGPVTGDIVARGVLARISDASPPCGFELRPSSIVTHTGVSTHSIRVVAPSACAWTAAPSDPSWLIPTPSAGTGTGVITFALTPTQLATRIGTVTIGNGAAQQILTVQQGYCTVSAPAPQVQPASGGSLVLNLLGPTFCPWRAVFDAPWMTVTPSSGVAEFPMTTPVTVTLAPNTGFNGRGARIDFTPNTGVFVQQAPRCSASLSSSSITMPRVGGTTMVTLTVTPPECQWTARSNVPWLTPSTGSGTGTHVLRIDAGANTGSSRFAALDIAGQALSVSQSGTPPSNAPLVYPPSPPAGSGLAETFTFTFYDSNGASTLDVVNVLINNVLDGRSACYLAYARSINVLYLVNDGGDGLLPGLVLDGSPQSVGNSQCQIDGLGSSVTASGNVLTLTLKVSFSPEFAGSKVVFQAGRDVSGFNSGWVQQGVWNVPDAGAQPLKVLAMAPARGAGSEFPFRFTFRNQDGASSIVSTSILINGYIDGFRGCYLGYHVPSNSVLLLNDAGSAYIAGVTLGTNVTVENSQCRIKALQSGAEINGTDLTLTLMIEFKVGFAGDRVFYVSAQDGVATSGWQAMGSWTVP